MRVDVGYNPTIYGWFYDETINSDSRNGLSTSVCGHLIFDEMKLKTGVCWRTSDHKACGFVSSSSTLTLTNTLRDMLTVVQNENDEVVSSVMWEENFVPAVYVNQWRYRSTYGVLHNAEFFLMMVPSTEMNYWIS